LIYNVTDAGQTATSARTVEIGKEFSFTMTLDKDYGDEELAGKKVKFTVNVKKALPSVYPDSYIADRLKAFLRKRKPRKTRLSSATPLPLISRVRSMTSLLRAVPDPTICLSRAKALFFPNSKIS
jgi:hypothetical protein